MPRTVTSRVALRAWIDPHVRTAWLAGLSLIVVGIGFLVQRYTLWQQASRLITDGVATDAMIVEVNGSKLVGRSEAGDRPLTLRFSREGKSYEFRVPYLDGRMAEEPLVVGQTVKIRVDPADPNRWSPRRAPAPLGPDLVGGSIVLCSGLLLCVLAAFLRASVVKTYRSAPLLESVVLSARHAAIAPRAWQVRCSPIAETDDRVFTVYAPARTVVTNTTLRLLTPERGRPLAMEWFE